MLVDMTDNLSRRIFEHKQRLVEGFTKIYRVTSLVYYEVHPDLESAIKRERQSKNWHSQWKINLIKDKNKVWKDLYPDFSDPLRLIYS